VIAAAEAAKLVKVVTPANRITPNDAYLLLASIAPTEPVQQH
jgi:hypothetical protein